MRSVRYSYSFTVIIVSILAGSTRLSPLWELVCLQVGHTIINDERPVTVDPDRRLPRSASREKLPLKIFSLGRSKGRNGRSLFSQGGKIRSIHEPNDAGVNGLENAIAGAEYEVGDG